MKRANVIYANIMCNNRMLFSRAYLYGKVHSPFLRVRKK